jgi:methanogenic corrinoid protein MtbC1
MQAPGAPSGTAVRSLAREVVQRLSRAHSNGAQAAVAEAPPDELDLFCTALTGQDDALAERLAREAFEGGLSFDALCETRLAPAARRLGTMWEEDRLSFADVSLAANRLFGLLRTLAHRPTPLMDARFAVFAAPPGEEHVLGVSMAAERARGAGWDVALLVGLGHDALVARISGMTPDVIGLALASERALLPLTRLVVALRVVVPAAPVVVCGPGVARVAGPIVGVDAMASDFDQAMAALAPLAG